MMLKVKAKQKWLVSTYTMTHYDIPSKNFKQLSNSIVTLGLVDKSVENVVDLLANVGAKAQEFSIDAMQRCLEKVTFPGVFAIEKFE